MKRSILIATLIWLSADAVYDHRPAERFYRLLGMLDGAAASKLKPIIYNPERTKGEIVADVGNWIQTQPGYILFQFMSSQLQYKRFDEMRNQQLDEMESRVSPKAREFNQKIRNIYDDMNITDRETCEAVSEAIRNAERSIRQELNIQPMECAKIFAQLLS